jgi:putative salt-induced outer membrane protein YdiY
MRGIWIVSGLLCGGLVSDVASADWSGKGALGGVLARGNTETETINAVIDVQNDLDRWTHKFGGSILHTVNNDITSADRWELRAGSNYKLTAQLSLRHAALRRRRFTDFSYQAGGSGYGYHLIANDVTSDVEAGVGSEVGDCHGRDTTT